MIKARPVDRRDDRGWLLPALLLLVSCFALAPSVQAALPTPGAPDLSARSYVLLDYATDQVIVDRDADRPVPPASITKLMTAYLTFQAIDSVTFVLTTR